MKEIEVIKAPDSNKEFAVIYKPRGLASAPLKADDKDNALAQAAALFPQILSVQGRKEIEYGLIHRLDTATSGLLVIAASQKCYDFLMEEQAQNRIIKTYFAECDLLKCQLQGFPPFETAIEKDFEVSSYFRPYGQGRKEVRPVTQASGKAAIKKLGKAQLYTTKIKIIEEDKKTLKAKLLCTITNGYRHQVRCHLAWSGFPVQNDLLYNPAAGALKNKSTEAMRFCAFSIQFEYPRGDLNSYDRKDTWT